MENIQHVPTRNCQVSEVNEYIVTDNGGNRVQDIIEFCPILYNNE